MGDAPVITVEEVSKKFCRRLRYSLWYGLTDLAAELTAYNGNSDLKLRHAEFVAVDNVSFEVRPGECLGLIGQNGAGKSTLLKMLNGLIRPDKGRITMRGRVGALIELGAGFSPILTGRENIYINGAILGFSKREIDAKLDEIVDFAELCDAIDAPVQTYSSGMYIRLGFAVAAQLNPDILLVDEVLAVGDAAFRLKCMSTIRKRVDAGMAIILVSHDMRNVINVCQRVIWLDKGSIREAGLPSAVSSHYEKHTLRNACTGVRGLNTTYFDPRGGAQFTEVGSMGRLAEELLGYSQDDAIEIDFRIQTTRHLDSLFFNYLLRTIDDTMILGAREAITPLCSDANHYIVNWRLPAGFLMPGTYKLEAALAHEYRWGTNIQELRPACIFAITGTTMKAGVCDLPVTVTTRLVDEAKFL
jgi:ABC-type polysaccharide/polyol phosphate transport system ATPase subunit